MLTLNQIHNLSMNCNTESELNEYLLANRCTIRTQLAGDHTKLPIYYFTASKTSGMKQDRNGNWYKPESKVFKAMINAGIHMIDAAKLRADDLTSDKFFVIFIMDGYEENETFNGVDVSKFYYSNEDAILAELENYIYNVKYKGA